jgi:hypothetical protein
MEVPRVAFIQTVCTVDNGKHIMDYHLHICRYLSKDPYQS